MELTSRQIAQVCHEAIRAYCASIGDYSYPTWDMAAEWLESSTTAIVSLVLSGSEVTSEKCHEKWLSFMGSSGWKFGMLKAPEKLEHDAMMPFPKLSEKERIKYDLLISIVQALGWVNKAMGVIKEEEVKSIVSAPQSSKRKRGM